MNHDEQAVDITGKAYNRGLMVLVLLIGAFCTILNQTILSTAFPALMNAFNISTSTVQWLTTGFLMVKRDHDPGQCLPEQPFQHQAIIHPRDVDL